MTEPIVLPRVIGHRGSAATAPENTAAGFRRAAADGASWVEFDVRLAADGVPVVIHDPTLRRTTGAKGRVIDKTTAELAVLDAGRRFAGAFAGEGVPSLAETCALLGELGLGANVEIKPEPAQGAQAARAVARVLDEAWPHALPPPLVSSFDWGALATLVAEAPQWPRGLLMRRPPHDWAGWARRLGVVSLHVGDRGLDRATVAALKASGLPVLVYTVNRAARARRLFDWGVDSVFSDRPGALIRTLGRKVVFSGTGSYIPGPRG
jgi:glycerophosphoryl diester phosphodiesterase